MSKYEPTTLGKPSESTRTPPEEQQAAQGYRPPQVFAIGSATELMRGNPQGTQWDSKGNWCFP